MAKEAFFEITIEDGEMQVEGFGFKGKGCTDLIQVLEAAGKAGERKLKRDYYKRDGKVASRTGQTA